MKVTGEKADFATAKAELRAELERALTRQKGFANVPTPERSARAKVAPSVIRVVPHAGDSSPKAHKFEQPLEAIMHKLYAHEYHAADRLRWAYESRVAHPRVGDYGTGVGRSDPSQRLGVSETQRKAAERWAFFEPRISPRTREILNVMVLRRPNGEMPTVADAMEWSKEYTPTVRRETAKPVWEVALRLVCEILAWLDREYGREMSRRYDEAKLRRQRSFANDGR